MNRYFDTKLTKLLIYGLMNGMSLLLSSSVINFWLASYKIDPKIIGLFSIIVLPYGLKYFIALFINSLHIKRKQYKLWLICSLLLIAGCQVLMSKLKLPNDIVFVALNGFLIALFSVIQDIILSSHRIQEFQGDLQVNATAFYSAGYRIGMLITGAGTIFCSAYMSWSVIFITLSLVYLLLTIFIALFFHERAVIEGFEFPNTNKSMWHKIFIHPFINFGSLKKIVWLIIFVLIYRLADNMLIVMINPFFVDIGYSSQEIALIYKGFGTLVVILGGFLCAKLVHKFGIRSCIIYFAIAHSLVITLFIMLSITGKSLTMLYMISTYEALTSGMSMTIYISFISSSCKGEYTASQYALLSSGMGLSRVIFPAFSGILVDNFSMQGFFIITQFISVISIFVIYYVFSKNYLFVMEDSKN